MIVVEGPDGAGKTTLIETISRDLDIPVAPRVVSKDAEAMVDLKLWVEENVRQGFQRRIYDRHRLISEPIYGPALREKPEPGFDDPDWFHLHLQHFYDNEPMVIYCLPPFSEVWRNVTSDNDNRVVQARHIIRGIYGAYWNKAHTDQVLYKNAWIYDYTDESFASNLVQIMKNHIISTVIKKVGL